MGRYNGGLLMVDTAPTKIVPMGRPDRKPRADAGTPRRKSLEKPLNNLITSLGVTVSLVNQTDGQAIIEGSDRLAKSLNELAKENPTVHKNLTRMLTGSAWGSVFIAAGGIAIPILANHNLLPFQFVPGGQDESPKPIPDIGPPIATD